jgi:hypothetical protein
MHTVCQRGIDYTADHHHNVVLKIGVHGLWEGHMKLYGFYRDGLDQEKQNYDPSSM